LDEIFGGDIDMVNFIHRAIGYTLTGSIREQVCFMCYGTGANGKSVLFTTLRNIFGDYAKKAASGLFSAKGTSSISNDVADVQGARLVLLTELPHNEVLNEAVLKQLVHGDEVTARRLYENNVEFSPVAKYWVACNHKPKVNDDSKGFWRSMLTIPFEQSFTGSKADLNLQQKLDAEAVGILAWAVQGCLEYQGGGLNPPAKVINATNEYREESDKLADFIADNNVMFGDDYTIKASKIYTAYSEWAKSSGFGERYILSNTIFAKLVCGRDGITKKRFKDGIYYYGIGFPTAEDMEKEGLKQLSDMHGG
jgi:putative DNA primase/helicase